MRRVAVIAVLAIAIVLVVRHRATPGRAVQFAAGTEYEYALSWQDHQRVAIAGDGAMTGAVDLRGTLIVRGYGGSLVGVTFAALPTHDVTIQGQTLLADDTPLAGHEVLVELGPDGALTSASFAAGAPLVLRQLAPVLLSELDFRTHGTPAVATPFGTATTRFAAGAETTERTREAYTQLVIVPGGLGRDAPHVTSHAIAVLAPAGHWLHVDDAEHVTLGDRVDADVALSLDLVAVRPAAVSRPALAGRVAQRLGAIALAGDERSTLAKKVDGLTRTELYEGLAGAVADENRWLWRASGLVEQDASLAAELGDRVAAGTLAGQHAELALDLLAAAGTPEAQAALRVALASPTVRAARNYDLMVQRVSLVAHPTPETERFASELYRASGTAPTAYALGAVARHLAESGDAGGATRCATQLSEALARSGAPREQAALLGALGNAADPSRVPLVVRFATSDVATVRAAAARALRDTDTPIARAELHALFADPTTAVQHQAIEALRKHAIGAADLAALAAHVDALRGGNEDGLVTLAAAHGAAGTDLLRAIAARPSTFPELRARIATLLERSPGS